MNLFLWTRALSKYGDVYTKSACCRRKRTCQRKAEIQLCLGTAFVPYFPHISVINTA